MGFYMYELSGPRATNIIKWAHDWQNDGYQNSILYSDSNEKLCPTGCVELESPTYLLSCKALQYILSFRSRFDTFRKVHKRLRTASVITSAFFRLIVYLSDGGVELPNTISHYISPFHTLENQAWQDQKKIWWSQLIKGRMSKKRGQVQSMYYGFNVEYKR